MNLSASAARDARHNTGSRLRARAVASFAKFQPRNADFRVYPGRGFLEGQFHVVAKVRAALRAASAAPAAENIFKSKEVAENILEFVKDSLIDAAIEPAARQACVAEAVIRDAFLRVGENRIRFRRFAEFFLGFLLGMRVAVGMPLQSRFAVSGFYLVGVGGTPHAKDFIAVAFFTHRLCRPIGLIFICVGVPAFFGIHGNAHNRGPQNAPVKRVPVLKYGDDKPVRIIPGFQALNRLMLVRVEYFPRRINALDAVLGDRIPELLADQRDSLTIFLISRVVVRLQRPIERIQHGNEVGDQPLDPAAAFFVTIALGPLSEILEIGLAADHRLQQFFLLGLELLEFLSQRSFAACRWIGGRWIVRRCPRIVLPLAAANAVDGYHFFFLAFRFCHVG